MKQSIYLYITSILCLILTSCGGKNFTINGSFSDAGTQNLRFVYTTGESVVSQWVPAVGGKITMQGKCSDLTVVYIYNAKMKFLAHVAVKNGEEINISGKLTDNYRFAVEGSDINTEWYNFIHANAEDYKAGNSARLDKSIEKYIKANPNNIVSTLLLTCDYSKIESPQAKLLLESIDEEAKPQTLLALYGSLLQKDVQKAVKVKPFSVRNEKDSLVLVELKKKTNIFYFWYSKEESDTTRKGIIKALKEINKGDSIAIRDICVNPDTMGWYKFIKKDSVSWAHYKAIGGPVDEAIHDLDIKGYNYFIVADSVGNQLYRGTSVTEARKAIINSGNKK